MKLSSYLTLLQSAEILKSYVSDIDNEACFTGMMISASELFSISDGVVVAVEGNDQYKCQVTVQYSNNIYFRYLNVKNVALKITDVVKQKDKIGDCIDNKAVFEYIAAIQSDWPVAINGNKLFKNDPMLAVVNEQYLVFNNRIENVTDKSFNNTELDLSSDMNEEFTGNRGDDR